MPTVKKSALVPYTAEQMFQLVNAVSDYPSFLPWCPKATVLDETDTEMSATIYVAKGPLKEHFTTQNRLYSPHHIHLTLIEGPFKQLEGDWRFENIASLGCRVTLDLHFEFKSNWGAKILSPIFQTIANNFVAAFCERAHQLHGPKAAP